MLGRFSRRFPELMRRVGLKQGSGPLFTYGQTTWTRASEAAFYDPRTATFQGTTSFAEIYTTSAFDTWTETGTLNPTTGVSDPDGGTSAVTIEDDDGGVYESIFESHGASAPGSVVQATVFIRYVSGDGIAQWNLGVGAGLSRFQLRLSDGVTDNVADTDENLLGTSTATDVGGGWWRWDATVYTSSGGTVSSRLYPAAALTLGTNAASAVGVVSLYDLTITSNAAYLDDDTARIFAGGELLAEEARTNPVQESIDLSSWSDVFGAGTVSVTATAAPDGGVAYEVEDADASGPEARENFTTGLTLGTGTTYTASAFVEKNRGVVSGFYLGPRSGSAVTGGTIIVQVDSDTGSTAVETGTPSGSVAVDDAGDWWRISFQFTMATAGNATLRWYPARTDAVGNASDSTQTGACGLWGAQVEEGEFPTSPIRTSGAAATRAAEYGALASASVPNHILSRRWSLVWRPLHSSAELVAAGAGENLFGWNNSLERVYLLSTGELRVNGGGSTRVTTSGLTWDALDEITLTFDPAAGTVEVSGATGGNGVHTGTAWTWPSGDMYWGHYGPFGSGGANAVFRTPKAAS